MAQTDSATEPGANAAGRSSAGRRAGGDSDRVRKDLLEAARQHFLSSDFKAVSVRQIAESAAVNGAMINYYFGGKRGLYLAMVDDMLQQLEGKLAGLSSSETLSIADFSRGYTALLATNPWWPNFMVREVLFGEGEMREAVIEKFSAQVGPRLIELVRREIADGKYRPDLDPSLTVISLMAMTIFPYLARPLLEQVFQLQINQDMAGELAAHTTRLFLQGVETRPAAGASS